MNGTLRWFRILVLAVAVGAVLWPVTVPAQASGESVAVENSGTGEPMAGPATAGMSWQEILESGGWLMYVLAALSVLTVAFVIYFFVVLRASQVAPRVLRRDVVEKIREGALDDARRACEYRACPLAAVALVGMDYLHESPDVDPMLLKDIIEGEGGRQAESIQGQTQLLNDIAVVAPMIGLLGTVFGMLRAFSSVALNEAAAKPVVLAQGVSQALITTAFGLIVGIPAMMFYAYFRRRAAKQVSHLEAAAAEVLSALVGKERK